MGYLASGRFMPGSSQMAAKFFQPVQACPWLRGDSTLVMEPNSVLIYPPASVTIP
jgi:hypothetical protein